MLTLWIPMLAAAYLIGSIPFGVLLAAAKGVDIREHGSRNIGATNVGRVLGRRLGLLCFALDLCKGAVPVLGAGLAAGVVGRPAASADPAADALSASEMLLWLGVALAAVVGHMFPVFLRFKGGKGVATGFGAMAAMWPPLTVPALVALLVWGATLRATRYVSVASMVAAASLPVGYAVWVAHDGLLEQTPVETVRQILRGWPPLAFSAAMALLVVHRHRANIGRLRRGEEPRIGAKRGKPPSTD